MKNEQHTPAADWREKGEPDPHGSYYDRERHELCMGKFTDDELANGAFMNYDVRPPLNDIISGKSHSPIAWMTAVKDRIRWLSRRMVKAEKQRDEFLEALNGLIDFIEIDKLAMDKDALQIARAAIASVKGGAA